MSCKFSKIGRSAGTTVEESHLFELKHRHNSPVFSAAVEFDNIVSYYITLIHQDSIVFNKNIINILKYKWHFSLTEDNMDRYDPGVNRRQEFFLCCGFRSHSQACDLQLSCTVL